MYLFIVVYSDDAFMSRVKQQSPRFTTLVYISLDQQPSQRPPTSPAFTTFVQ